MNLFDYLLENAVDEKLAIRSRDEQVSYSQLKAMAEQIAFALAQYQIQKGERVAILAENSSFWVASYLAILKIGAVAVPIPQRLSAETLRKLIEIMDIQAFCVDSSRFILYEADLGAKLVFPQEVLGDSVPTAEIREREDLAALMFTSGSSGQPNAVKISHRNIMANTDSIISYLELGSEDSIMVVLPFDYCFGTSLLHSHLRVGGTLLINNRFGFVETVLEDMELFGCTGFAGVPTVYQHLLRGSGLQRYKFPRLRYVQQAGGRLPDLFIKQFQDALPQVRFYVMYGQTEATARLSYLPPEQIGKKLGSIGCGIPNVSLNVLDEEGKPVSGDAVGEIVAEGDNIALGYWLPEAKNSFRHGKLYTGDLARVDEDGFIYLMGRRSEFLKLNGHRLSSTEIEDVLFALPDVLEAAVIGVHDPEAGESAKAYLVLREGAELSNEDVIRHCKRHLAAYAVPRYVEFLAELPKNAAGKVLKSQLKG